MSRLLAATFSIAGFVGGLWALSYTDACAYEMPYDPYPWCANYAGRSQFDSINCGFLTLEQCRATVRGIGGFCEPNLFYNPHRWRSQGHRRKPR